MLRHALPQTKAFAFGIIIVKARAKTTSLAAKLDHHQLHKVFGAAWLIRVAQFLLGRLHHVIPELQRRFIKQRQRTYRHT